MKYFTQPIISNTYKMLCKISKKLHQNFQGSGNSKKNWKFLK